jgi:hypothetical protein
MKLMKDETLKTERIGITNSLYLISFRIIAFSEGAGRLTEKKE